MSFTVSLFSFFSVGSGFRFVFFFFPFSHEGVVTL